MAQSDICSVSYCELLVGVGGRKGLCQNHYARMRRGLPGWDQPSQYEKTIEQRFWEKVDKNGPVVDDSDPLVDGRVIGTQCWVWTANAPDGRYGHFVVDGLTWQAHNYSLALAGRPPLPGMQTDHLCRNTFCVNPEHLESVTVKINSNRSDSVAGKNHRKTQCKRGHVFEPGSYYVKRDGARQCKACNLLYGQKSYRGGKARGQD